MVKRRIIVTMATMTNTRPIESMVTIVAEVTMVNRMTWMTRVTVKDDGGDVDDKVNEVADDAQGDGFEDDGNIHMELIRLDMCMLNKDTYDNEKVARCCRNTPCHQARDPTHRDDILGHGPADALKGHRQWRPLVQQVVRADHGEHQGHAEERQEHEEDGGHRAQGDGLLRVVRLLG